MKIGKWNPRNDISKEGARDQGQGYEAGVPSKLIKGKGTGTLITGP
jgi:hypothetical protein